VKLYGLVSSYNEGSLLDLCVSSLLDGTEKVFLYEGPFGEVNSKQEPLPTWVYEDTDILLRVDKWENQARKLTELTTLACRVANTTEPVWGMHLDGDEVLLWPQFLRDIVERFTEELPKEPYMQIKVVEMDGTVSLTPTHLIRLDLVENYFVSGSQVLFKGNSIPVALANVPSGTAPIMGEPHILHRSPLRSKNRSAPEIRAHLSQEAEWFEKAASKQGLGGIRLGD
jgi:hypothetical protein